MKKRQYTWVRDKHDERDHPYGLAHVRVEVPPSVDLEPMLPPAFDQGDLSSCTGNALAAAVGFVHGLMVALSRLFIWYNERAIEHTVRQDTGAYIRDGIKALSKLGVCEETVWAYVAAKFKSKPPAAAYEAALKYKISTYRRLTTLDDMLQCLAGGHPFVFGFEVYTAFESEEVAKTGVLNMPARGEKNLGGHAVLCVGYDLAAQRFKVRNSWSPTWGQKGYFTMPFTYLTAPKLADDFWTIRA